MKTHVTLDTQQISGLLTLHQLAETQEYDLLMQMDYVLRKRKRTALTLEQTSWLMAIPERTPKASLH